MANQAAARQTAKRNHRLGKEVRSKALLSAALELFVEKGFAAARLDDIAARAGVSKGTVYLYFRNKDELFQAVIRETILPVLAESEILVAGFDGDASALLRRVLWSWWRLVGSTPLAGVLKLIICEAGNFPETARYCHEKVILRGRRLFGDVLEQGMAAGEFRPMDIETAIDLIIAPVVMLAIWDFSLGPSCTDADRDPARYLGTHFDLLCGGVISRLAGSAGGN